ncbi:hypothetical protein F3Y22_tig00111191pilonHSYRG00234 [Hibiscus syriacus]|uniref:Leucine-rich repeat-containing N-terminal plant-type domain-containing protein n=1 Tax=Hibiscus syriacus TaxID=106335 RepID=A0A6A2YXP3_HIBSY|nr:receptor-like protein 6 [Hibiscus syriacus]KAE8683765.1 hypothetical protein F3Y22_tig00111191pilonHSYRG00234 [Hibiscus syriacus]
MKEWLISSYFVLFSLFFAYNAYASTLLSCPHDQSVALIQFSNSFSIDCLQSWECQVSQAKTMWWKKGTNCCLWDGIKCGTETGNVIGLDLSCSCLAGPISSNSTLFLLRHLQELNLAGNNFNMFPIAPQFGQLTSLTHLNISTSSFSGKIPHEISHLSKLSSLDLSDNYHLMFEGHVFENVVGNLTQLRHLLLSGANMSLVEPASFLNVSSYITTLTLGATKLQGKFPEDVFHFPRLQEFSVSGSYLEVKFPKTNWSGPLKSLQVSFSYLQELPNSIGNLRSLEILDLRNSNLRGTIPTTLANLTHLRYLDLSYNNLVGQISDSFGNLTNLIHLSLRDNKLSGLLPVSAFNLPQVQVLEFSNNSLVGSLPSKVCGLSRLPKLYLDHNFLSGRVPSWLFSLPSLKVLSLHNNRLTGPIDEFDKVAPLEVVDLFSNEIQGPIPYSFSQLVNLIDIDLSFNDLSGSFEMDKLSNLSKLVSMDLSNNTLLSLSSASSNTTYSLPNLSTLLLSSCNIREFPNFVRNLEGLTSLDLSYNKVRVIEADMFLKLKNLLYLDLSHNNPLFVSNNSQVSLVLPNLNSLSLSSCNITKFSNFLTTQESLRELDLSNNSIQGQITKEEINWRSKLQFVDLSDNLLTVVEYSSWQNLQVLNLGSNLLEGPLPPPPPSTSVLLISKNKLIGEIPPSICNLSHSDIVLDLSHNNLSGAIPRCLGLRNIYVLDLQMNHLHGTIPDFCVKGSHELHTLNLNNNDFDGPLPMSLANCHNLEVLNLGNNKINDTFPHWLGTLPRLQVLVLRANYFYGQIIDLRIGSPFLTLRILDLSHNKLSGYLPTTYFRTFQGMMSLGDNQMRYMDDGSYYYQDSLVVTMKGGDFELERILTIFAALDMSSNRFEGIIPEEVGNLISLQVLNFSHNHLTGHIPSSLGNVAALESLDLSCNRLVGEIPSQLAGLNFLEVLNLAENHLVGLIPQGKQFNTFLNDSYIGNTGLCGFPVSKGCGQNEPPAPVVYEHDNDSAFGLDWKFVVMGYSCGLVFGFSAGYIMMTIRKPKWLVGMIQRAGNKLVRRFKKYR